MKIKKIAVTGVASMMMAGLIAGTTMGAEAFFPQMGEFQRTAMSEIGQTPDFENGGAFMGESSGESVDDRQAGVIELPEFPELNEGGKMNDGQELPEFPEMNEGGKMNDEPELNEGGKMNDEPELPELPELNEGGEMDEKPELSGLVKQEPAENGIKNFIKELFSFFHVTVDDRVIDEVLERLWIGTSNQGQQTAIPFM